MNVDSDKPRFIECVYETSITFDLEELGIEWDKVKDYHVKWGTLYVEFKDGSSVQHDGITDIGEIDYKWAEKENILTDSWDKVEGLN